MGARSAHDALSEYLEDIPQDLAVYFEQIADGSLSNAEDIGLNLLLPGDVAEQTRRFRGFHPVVQKLGGVVLDDGNTSNHHVYLSEPPFAGTVLFLDHGGDSRVVYPSIAGFLEAASQAKKQGVWLADLHPEGSVLPEDQESLSALASGLLDAYDEAGDTTMVLTSIIPSMDLRDVDLLGRLAAHDDFYLGEAVANEARKRPSPELAPVIQLCCEHPDQQVSNAGKAAKGALRRQAMKP